MSVYKVLGKRGSLQQVKVATQIILNSKYSSGTEDNIEIPQRIHRGPTDILRALESTISRDPTAAHYKYHDDPFLIPMSNIEKRTFALAKEAGKKAAHFVRSENPELFNHQVCDPPIESFFPKKVFCEDSDVTEKDLKKLIEDVLISDAIFVYKLLKEKNIDVSPQTQQSLLDLVCYFNSSDALNEEFMEERWFRQSSFGKERQRKTWNDGGFAEELFNALENPSAEAYNSIIQGMCKYFQAERAYQLFEQAQEKNITLDTDTYNSLIKMAYFVKESYQKRWEMVTELLDGMNKAQRKPNLGTLNACLQILSTMGIGKFNKEKALAVLREFKELGVEPSLGSWYFLLITYCKERGPISTIIYDILPQIENKSHTIRDINDTNFFVTAMDICRNHLKDVELAKRVDKLLNLHNNYDLIGDSYKESIYYRHYFILLLTHTPLDEFIENTYYKLVPHIYVPEPSVMKELLTQIDLNAAVGYIPKIWSDMIIFDHVSRQDLIEFVADIMVNNNPEDAQLTERFACIGWDIFERVESVENHKYNKISFTGDLLGKIMIVLLRNNEFPKACKVMDKLDRDHTSIVGVPQLEALSLFVDHCIEEKVPSLAITCIQYCSDSGFPEASILAAKLNEKLTLDENHLNSLSRIVGDMALGQKLQT